MSDTSTWPFPRVVSDHRGGAVALLVLLGVGAGVTSRRRARRRRRTTLLMTQASHATDVRGSGTTRAPVSDFDRVEQERPAWPEPDDALPAEVPAEAPEADYLEQARELPIDEDDRAD